MRTTQHTIIAGLLTAVLSAFGATKVHSEETKPIEQAPAEARDLAPAEGQSAVAHPSKHARAHHSGAHHKRHAKVHKHHGKTETPQEEAREERSGNEKTQ